jgi:hypothetical protein
LSGAEAGEAGGAHARTQRHAGGHGRTRGDGGPSERLALLVFALLVTGCFAAFVVTQRLKHTPTPVQEFEMNTSFLPQSAGAHRLEAISFKLASADRVTVTILSSSGGDVATLVRDRPVGRYRKLSLRWDGHEGIPHGYSVLRSPHGYESLLPALRGPVAPAGVYHVRVSLRAQKRTIRSSRAFTLVRP